MSLPDSRREKGEAQVRKVVEAGITTFVCLQVYDRISNGTLHATPLPVPYPLFAPVLAQQLALSTYAADTYCIDNNFHLKARTSCSL